MSKNLKNISQNCFNTVQSAVDWVKRATNFRDNRFSVLRLGGQWHNIEVLLKEISIMKEHLAEAIEMIDNDCRAFINESNKVFELRKELNETSKLGLLLQETKDALMEENLNFRKRIKWLEEH